MLLLTPYQIIPKRKPRPVLPRKRPQPPPPVLPVKPPEVVLPPKRKNITKTAADITAVATIIEIITAEVTVVIRLIRITTNRINDVIVKCLMQMVVRVQRPPKWPKLRSMPLLASSASMTIVEGL